MTQRIGETSDLLKCNFCGKTQKQVKKLIAGPGVYICDECIELCNEIIIEELQESSSLGLQELPKPQEDRKSTRLNSSHIPLSRMPSSA